MKKKKVFLGLAIASLGLFSLAACASNPATSSSVSAPEASASSSEVIPEVQPLTFDLDEVRVFYQVNDNFEKEGLKVYKTVDGEPVELAEADYRLDFSGFDKTKVGNYKIKVIADGYEGEFGVFVREDDFSDYKAISTAEEFNAFRNLVSSDEKYMLTQDIDLEGITLEATKVIFSGKFDGAGHVIKNAIYRENASNKTGILTRELANGAVITDVRFSNCVAELSGETIAIIAGMTADTVTISKVEFSNCYAKCNNYAGLVIGRTNSKASVVNMSEITCKNGTYTKVTSYGGTLIGDIAAGESATNRATVNIENCDLAIELKGANKNGGFLSGRIRNNTNLNIKNVLIRSAIIEANASGDAGLICGGGDNNAGNSTVTVENLYVASTNSKLLQSCAIQTGTNPVTTFQITYTNAYMASDALEAVTDKGTYLQPVDKATADINWLKDTLLLNFGEDGAWTAEANDATAYRLVNSSTNVKSPDATIKTLKLSTANATLRFEKGTDFTSDGLSVTGIYSDDVNLPLDTATGYEVDSTAFNKDVAGKYTITVKSKEDANVKATYQVEVVAQTAVTVDTQFAKLTYMVGEELDLSKLLVYAKWTDDKELLTKAYTTNKDSIDMSTAGRKNLTVTMAGFDPVNVRISVVDTKPAVVDNYVYINVNGASNIVYSGQKVEGVETFTTINDAIEYLVSANLGDVNKVIYVADGVYNEKLTVPASLKNLKIIGQSVANTKIEYDAVEDTIDPISGERYVMNCATLHVNAEGFGLENITVSNTFDYINDNTKYGNPQGFALTINADGAVLNKVKLYGNQDTLFFRNGRVYIKDSEIDGNIDFIFGENTGIAFFDTCTIKALGKSATPQKNNGYVTAMKGDKTNHPTYGYVFSNCTFTDDGNVAEGAMSLGRPWGEGATVTYINCSFTKAYSKLPYDGSAKSRWFDMSGNNPTNAHFAEYGSTGEGAITTAVAGGSVLTEAEAANYTAANTFAKTNGGVTWTAAFDYQTAYNELNAAIAKVAATEIKVFDGATEVGETFSVPNDDYVDLKVVTKEWNATNKTITATSQNESIATIVNGRLTGVAVGETTVTFTLGTVTKTITVTVVDTPKYTVQFDTNGGTTVANQTVARNKKATMPTVTKDNAVFKGWFKDAAFTTPFDFDKDVITADTTIYARFVDWTDMYKENITVYFDGTSGDGVSSFKYDNETQTAATYYGLAVTGKFVFRPNNNDVQYNAGIEVSFNVGAYATITLTQKAAFNVKFFLDGVEVTPTVNGTVVTYETTKAGVFKMKNAETGNKYVSGLTVTYPEIITKTTKIDFGSNGNYTDVTALNDADANYGQIQAACNQIKGDLVFYVNPGATISISGNWSVGYEINGNEVKTSNAGGTDDTGLNYSYECTAGGKVLIHSIHNNNYFYSITVTYPAQIENDVEISFAEGGNGYGAIDGVTISGNCASHDATCAKINNATIKLNLKAAAKVTIVGNWGIHFTIGGTEVQNTNAGGTYSGTDYEYDAAAGELVITVGNTGSNYFKAIKVEYK